MRAYVVMRYVGVTLVVLAGVMFLMLIYSLAVDDGAWSIFCYSGLITALTGILPILFGPRERQLSEREGYSVVVYAWLFVCFFGMAPYILPVPGLNPHLDSQQPAQRSWLSSRRFQRAC